VPNTYCISVIITLFDPNLPVLVPVVLCSATKCSRSALNLLAPHDAWKRILICVGRSVREERPKMGCTQLAITGLTYTGITVERKANKMEENTQYYVDYGTKKFVDYMRFYLTTNRIGVDSK